METTALPKNVGIETMQITYTKENLRLTIGYRDGIYRLDTPCWQFSDFEELKALFDCLPMPGNTEVEVNPQPQPIAKAPAPKKAAKPAKKVRKNQFAKRWTDEQKREIAERTRTAKALPLSLKTTTSHLTPFSKSAYEWVPNVARLIPKSKKP